MPYSHPEFIAPEAFLQHDCRTIYHTYRDDEVEGGVMTYTFTTSEDDRDIDWRFDVRELPAWKADPFPLLPRDSKSPETFFEDEVAHIRHIVKKAIEAGEIRFP
jgi:hypothetical protein